ncbi:MAG: ATP synthase subunit I [Anaerolineae bacterium]
MSDWLWLLGGFLVGLLNVALVAGTVSRLQHNGNVRPPKAALSTTLRGFALRLILSMLVLVVALRHSVAAGLFTFAGIWLGRWMVLLWTPAPADRRKVET